MLTTLTGLVFQTTGSTVVGTQDDKSTHPDENVDHTDLLSRKDCNNRVVGTHDDKRSLAHPDVDHTAWPRRSDCNSAVVEKQDRR